VVEAFGDVWLLPPSNREDFATARKAFSLIVSRPMIVPGIRHGTTPTIEESQGGDTTLVKPLAIKDRSVYDLPPDITSTVPVMVE
jgi:hypothetical protein